MSQASWPVQFKLNRAALTAKNTDSHHVFIELAAGYPGIVAERAQAISDQYFERLAAYATTPQ